MFATAAPRSRLPVRLAKQLGLGFAFWLVFLLVLQSGNAARSATFGFGEEALRILAASALGALTTLLLAPLAARFPLRGSRWGLHLGGMIAAAAMIAAILVVIAWAGAPLVLSPDNPRLAAPLAVQLAADAPLLTFVIVGFMLLLQLPQPAPAAAVRSLSPAPASVSFIVRTRQGQVRLRADEIDWLEAQENYVALHCGPDTHLLRETLTAFVDRLGPKAFVRIHRRTVVNIARLRGLRSLPGGDAMANLDTGAELRVSRTYAGQVRERMERAE
jgi:DNA-binding LytR/AlgR family response regulator